ncbi:MAG: restriction endonuclease subunit S [Bacteroidetes bacterium]|nr:restriction endonuclease subunit S [Bacteroidota bacterium]
MKLNYRPIGEHIKLVDERNRDLQVKQLLGLSISKQFIPSVANIIGTDMKNYKIIRKNQFACSTMQVRRDKKMPVALLQDVDEAIISQAYPVFEVKDETKLLPEYLMMWFERTEFDREACFHAVGGVRGSLEWEDFEGMQLPIPHIDKQREIVKEYNTIQNRIKLNEQLIQKLEETAQAIYREWFVEGIDVENLPEGWKVEKLEQFTKMKYGKMLDSSLFLEKGYPIFSGYGVRGYYSEYMFEEPQILVLCRGVSGTGEVRMSPRFSYITNLSIVVEVDDLSVSKMYLYYYLSNSDLKSLDSGSAQSMITTGDLYFQNALLPPTELQMKFDRVANSIMKEIEVKNQENQKLMELKELLLSRLATVH